MRAIDLSKSATTLAEVIDLAGRENVVLKTSDGREFVVAEIDDFAQEVSLVRQNPALMQLLAERSKDETKLSLDEVRSRLGL